jgi:hypothetical protein
MMAGGVCHALGGHDGIHRENSDLPAVLARGDVVIVNTDLNRPIEMIEGYSDFLSEAEQCRAKEYVRDLDRNRYIRRRIALRRLLGNILGRDPRNIEIEPIHQASHSLLPMVVDRFRSTYPIRDRAIFAFAKERQVGIDLGRRVLD